MAEAAKQPIDESWVDTLARVPDQYEPHYPPSELHVIKRALPPLTNCKFNEIVCLYPPSDDALVVKWYEKHFNSCGTRSNGVFWQKPNAPGLTSNFMTDEWIEGESYEMFAIRFETDAIDELYERLLADDTLLEPLKDEGVKGRSFVFTDPYGNKHQVWQRAETKSQPLRDGVPALVTVAAIFFPVRDPKATSKWYAEVLGQEVGDSGQVITGTGQEIYFMRSLETGRVPDFTVNRRDIPGRFATVQVDGIEEMHRRLLERGERVEEKIRDGQGCGYSFQLLDPDGNMLDIWDIQFTVEQRHDRSDSSNWKDRFRFVNYAFGNLDVDQFLEKVLNGERDCTPGRVQIMRSAAIRKTDPDGLSQLIETLDEFVSDHPEHAFDIVCRGGNLTDEYMIPGQPGFQGAVVRDMILDPFSVEEIAAAHGKDPSELRRWYVQIVGVLPYLMIQRKKSIDEVQVLKEKVEELNSEIRRLSAGKGDTG